MSYTDKTVFKVNATTSTVTTSQCDLFSNWHPLVHQYKSEDTHDNQGLYYVLCYNGINTAPEYRLMTVNPNTSTFELMTTEFPVPIYNSDGLRINWNGRVLVNTARSEIYIIGETYITGETLNTCYILTVNYSTGYMQLSYFGGLSHVISGAAWSLLPDGHLLVSGGSSAANSAYNFYPVTNVYKIKPVE